MYDAYKKRGMLVVDAEVPPYSNETIDFFDLKPNYFRVQNKGATKVFCGVSKVPTDDNYDFFCKGESFTMYAEPHATGYLNVFNPSGSPVKIRVLGFAAPFDPLALAFSQIEIDFSDMEMKTEGVISEFRTSLPAGSNKIGKVDVASFPSTAPTLAKQNDMISKLETIVEKLSDLLLDKNKFVDHVSAWGSSGNNGETPICNGGAVIIHMLTNDGDADFDLIFIPSDGSESSTIALKPGETISDLRFSGTLKMNGNNYAFRIMCSYPF